MRHAPAARPGACRGARRRPASCRCSAAIRCARRSRSGAWSSPISASRSRSSEWRRTAPSRRRSWPPRGPARRSRSARGWCGSQSRGARRRPQLDRDRGRASRVAGRRRVRPQARRPAFSPTRRPKPTKRRSTRAGTGSSIRSSASRTREGRWQLRLWWKPFVTLIWLGGVLIALGGLLALIGRAGRTWREERCRREPRLPPACRSSCSSGVGASRLGMASHPAADTTIRSQLVNRQPVPQFALPPRCRCEARTDVGRSRDRGAAAGQYLRQLVRAVHRRSAGAEELKRQGVTIDAIAIRDRPEDVAAFLAPPRRPVRRGSGPTRTAASSSRSDRPACPKASSSMAGASSATSISARSSRTMSRRSSPSWRRRGEGNRCSLLASCWPSPVLADSPTCRLRTGPIASCPTRGRKRRRRPLMEELRCLVCQGQSIADSDAELAGDMRDLVRRRIAAGEEPARDPRLADRALRQLGQLPSAGRAGHLAAVGGAAHPAHLRRRRSSRAG